MTLLFLVKKNVISVRKCHFCPENDTSVHDFSVFQKIKNNTENDSCVFKISFRSTNYLVTKLREHDYHHGITTLNFRNNAEWLKTGNIIGFLQFREVFSLDSYNRCRSFFYSI